MGDSQRNILCHLYPELCQNEIVLEKLFGRGEALALPLVADAPQKSGPVGPVGPVEPVRPGASFLQKRVGFKFGKTASLSKEPPPKILQDYMRGINGKVDASSGFKVIAKGHKYSIIGNPETGELRINLEGAGPNDFGNVGRVALGIRARGQDVAQEKEVFDELFKTNHYNVVKEGARVKSIMIDGDTFTDIKFLGHSYGGHKARVYSERYGIPGVGLNVHETPLTRYKESKVPFEYHTILTDPTDFKFLETLPENVSHTYYEPLSRVDLEFAGTTAYGLTPEDAVSLGQHRAQAFETQERSGEYYEREPAPLTEFVKVDLPYQYETAKGLSKGLAGGYIGSKAADKLRDEIKDTTGVDIGEPTTVGIGGGLGSKLTGGSISGGVGGALAGYYTQKEVYDALIKAGVDPEVAKATSITTGGAAGGGAAAAVDVLATAEDIGLALAPETAGASIAIASAVGAGLGAAQYVGETAYELGKGAWQEALHGAPIDPYYVIPDYNPEDINSIQTFLEKQDQMNELQRQDQDAGISPGLRYVYNSDPSFKQEYPNISDFRDAVETGGE